jgi:hypothetical protein
MSNTSNAATSMPFVRHSPRLAEINAFKNALNTYAVVKCKSTPELVLRQNILIGHHDNLRATLPNGRNRDVLSMKYIAAIYTMLNANPELVSYEIAEAAFRAKNRVLADIEKSKHTHDPVFISQENALTAIFETFTDIYSSKYLFRNPIPLK